ncbi:hypothetical protein HC928_10045 [bacterium]|nr:hypothetical protein [bacterium]
MVTLGSGEVYFEPVEGSGVEIVRSIDGSMAAHVEHMVLVTKKGYEVDKRRIVLKDPIKERRSI